MSLFTKCCEVVYERICSFDFKVEMRADPKDFTRETPKLNFRNTISFILSGIRKSVQVDLNKFFERFRSENDESITVCKQAFFAARMKIMPRAFIEINDAVVSNVYDEQYKTFKGYRLLAIDGSSFEVPDVKSVRNFFGAEVNEPVRAHAAMIYDTLNGIILGAGLYARYIGERDQAMRLITALHFKQLNRKDIYLFDRGYPSAVLIDYFSLFDELGEKFIMRVSSSFLKPVNEANSPDQIVEGIYKNAKSVIPYKLRVINITLNTGEVEKLITNIFDESFTTEDFNKLYFSRWRIEIRFDTLKNKLQIENFSSQCIVGIKQDFFASIVISNLASLAKNEADVIIAKKQEFKNNKYGYQANNNLLIPLLIPVLIKCLYCNNNVQKALLFRELINKISKYTIPIRPGRSYSHKKHKSSNRFHQNARPGI